MQTETIYNENCLETMARMPDGFVDLTVTSPPYDNLRSYNGYEFDFEPIARELYRVTKKGGVVVWVVGDATINGSETGSSAEQKLGFRRIGWLIHDTMIYQKRNFSHPEVSRYHQVFEYMFVFSKGVPETFNPIHDRINLTAGMWGNLGVNTFTERDGSKSVRTKKLTKEIGMRHNVWLGNTRGQEEMCVTLEHPAMMPLWIARDHILSWSNENDIVYDPFMGSGTTAKAAHQLKRRWIGSEISSEYVELANKRLEPYLAQEGLF